MMTARKVASDLLMVLIMTAEEWRSVLITSGGQCVMMGGI